MRPCLGSSLSCHAHGSRCATHRLLRHLLPCRPKLCHRENDDVVTFNVGKYRMTGAFARVVMEHSRHRCPRSPQFAHLEMAFSLTIGIFDMRLMLPPSSSVDRGAVDACVARFFLSRFVDHRLWLSTRQHQRIFFSSSTLIHSALLCNRCGRKPTKDSLPRQSAHVIEDNAPMWC